MIRLIISGFALITFSSFSFAKDEPAIVNHEGVKTIVINDSIKKTLTQWNSKAKILEPENFSNKVWSLYTKKDPNSLPMAAVGDYNGDKIKDLGLLVKTRSEILAIVALSSKKKNYSIHVIKRFAINSSEVVARKSDVSGKKQYLVYLFAEHKKRLKHKRGLATRNGFQVEILNSSNTTVHYANNQKFFEYKGLVK